MYGLMDYISESKELKISDKQDDDRSSNSTFTVSVDAQAS